MSAPSRVVDPADAIQREHTDETLSIELIEHVTLLLAREDAGLKSFVQAMCATAPPQDIIRYTVPALAALARLAYATAKPHRRGECIVKILSPQTESKDYGRTESVLVAINDDMPFLFDSLLAE